MSLRNLDELRKKHVSTPSAGGKPLITPSPKKKNVGGRPPDSAVRENTGTATEKEVMDNFKRYLELYQISDRELTDKELKELFELSIKYEEENNGGKSMAGGARVSQPMKKIKEMWEDMLTTDQVREAWREFQDERMSRGKNKDKDKEGEDVNYNYGFQQPGMPGAFNPFMQGAPFFQSLPSQGIDLNKVNPDFMAGAMYTANVANQTGGKPNPGLMNVMQSLFQLSMQNAVKPSGSSSDNKAIAKTIDKVLTQFTNFMTNQQQQPIQDPYNNPQYMQNMYRMMNQPQQNGNSEMSLILKEVLQSNKANESSMMMQNFQQMNQSNQQFMTTIAQTMAQAVGSIGARSSPKDDFLEAMNITKGFLGERRARTEIDVTAEIEGKKIELEKEKMILKQNFLDRGEQRDHEMSLATMGIGKDALDMAGGLAGQFMAGRGKGGTKSKRGRTEDNVNENDLKYIPEA